LVIDRSPQGGGARKGKILIGSHPDGLARLSSPSFAALYAAIGLFALVSLRRPLLCGLESEARTGRAAACLCGIDLGISSFFLSFRHRGDELGHPRPACCSSSPSLSCRPLSDSIFSNKVHIVLAVGLGVSASLASRRRACRLLCLRPADRSGNGHSVCTSTLCSRGLVKGAGFRWAPSRRPCERECYGSDGHRLLALGAGLGFRAFWLNRQSRGPNQPASFLRRFFERAMGIGPAQFFSVAREPRRFRECRRGICCVSKGEVDPPQRERESGSAWKARPVVGRGNTAHCLLSAKLQ